MLPYQVLRIKEYIRYGPSSPSRALIPALTSEGGSQGPSLSSAPPPLCEPRARLSSPWLPTPPPPTHTEGRRVASEP